MCGTGNNDIRGCLFHVAVSGPRALPSGGREGIVFGGGR